MTRATFSHLAVESKLFAPATMSNLAVYHIGTVDKPLPGVSIKLAEDGEILVKGDNVFQGYWKMGEETRRSFMEDSYFMSGDIVSMTTVCMVISSRKQSWIQQARASQRARNTSRYSLDLLPERLFTADGLHAAAQVTARMVTA